ncbi:MAG TPA: MCE family protein, partial [Mycobacterium sp.]
MIDRLTRIQLMIFAVVTVLTVGAISIFYLRVPEAIGIGSYQVTANFVAGGGLYQNANVTYRGVTVGRVETVGLSDDGVVAHMRLQSGTPVPENVTAAVKSVSAIGEQYIDLVPPERPAAATLRNGSDIGMDRTTIGQDIYGLLQQADALVSSVGNSRIQDLLRETFKAFNGSGPELARLIQSSRLLVDEANANYGQTTQLIDQAGPFLEAQIRSGDDIRSLADGLARFTGEVANADPQLRSLLQTVPGAADAANTTFEGIRPTFPVLAANLANFGRIGVIYNKSLEHALVVFPALLAALNTVGGGLPTDEGGKLDFKIDLGDPPPCSVGFVPPPQIRSPADTTLRELPTDLYCKVPQNDPSVVRGARNYPCQEFPGKRAPTIQLCRDPKGYVPIGSNPWRGPPIPVGTPMDQREDNHYEPPGRNVLPPNKFPYIPPGMDPDPGPPVVQLPPGAVPGPGPAPAAPFPLPVPPNEPGVQPAPWPYFSPHDQVVPPYGRTPPGPPPAPAPAPAPAGPNPLLPAEAPPLASPAMTSYDR